MGELGVPLSHAVAEYVAAKRLMPSHPLSEAAQHWAKDHARAPSVTFIQVAGEFLTQQHQALSERSYREEKIRVGRLQSVLDVNMDDLSKSHIERFFSGVLTDHSGKTRNHYRQTLRQRAAREAMAHGLKEVEVRIKGPGSGRESAIRGLQAVGLDITTIKDVTPVPHNGCRPKKRRRV